MGKEQTLDVTRETLEATPARVLTFLRAAGTSKAIRALLTAKGYTPADHQEGWSLLHRVSGLAEATPDLDTDVAVRDAMNELDNWDEDGFRLVRAALTRKHAAPAAFVLNGLAPATGAAAVLSVKNLLDRLDALEGSPDRQATREADHAALATLERRGLGAAERKRLRGLVQKAQAASPVDPTDATADEAAKQNYLADLAALRAWFLEWADTARVAVKRKDYLIRLGLAKRKAPEKAGDEAEPDVEPVDD
jgi:hypothetical protein